MAITQYDAEELLYPDTDGQPMADNTKQFKAILRLEGNIEVLFKDDPNVFVAGNLFWYPVQGRQDIRAAPDVMVVFGRPKRHRRSYLQWREDNIPPQVVFEVASHSNTPKEWAEKLAFYEQYGVEEYYKYDPETGLWEGWLRSAEGRLEPIEQMEGWTSPRLGIVFGRGYEDDVGVSAPGIGRFVSFEDLASRLQEIASRAERERLRAERERLRAEQEQRRAEEARREAEQERQRAERLAQRLRELGIDPDRE